MMSCLTTTSQQSYPHFSLTDYLKWLYNFNMKKIILFFFVFSILLPTFVFAKEKNVVINDIISTTENSSLVQDFLNITISSNPEIEITKEVLPGSSILFIPVVDKDEINVVLNNLPNKNLYFYIDSLEKVIKHSINEVSTMTFSLNGYEPHLIFIKSQHSTKTIRNDATGGDCSTFGIWNQSTLTCTMTQDVFEVINIVSDGITLDGNGKMVKWNNGMGIGSGINIAFRNNIIVKNLIVEGFDYAFGVFWTRNSSFFNNETRGFGIGFYFSFEDFYDVINGNTITNTAGYLPGVDIISTGIYLGSLLQKVTVINNTISVTNYGLALVSGANNNKIYNNNFLSTPAIAPVVRLGNYLYQQMPVGGNYYRGYDTPEEGCNDVNNDFICDTPISFGNVIDKFPWIYKNGWDATCCSSIIFVPGFEGSRLYEKGKNGDLIQRWEAGIASLMDLNSLYLDNLGNSIKNIFVGDVIERTNYTPDSINSNFYSSIANWFRKTKTSSLINDFFMFPYDWRLDVSDLAQNGSISTNNEILNLKNKIIELSQNSKTDKITLIGHSNGGLLIKKTIQLLKNSGQENLVDKVITLGSPQLGTPKAIAAMLHGDGASLGLGFVLSSEKARSWGENMPGAYGLIPSKKYYQKVGPIVSFDESLNNNWISLYGNTLDYEEQNSFLTGQDGREKPAFDNLEFPTILNEFLLNKANELHDNIDNLEFPESIKFYEIAGVGVPTLKNLTYKSRLFGTVPVDYKLNFSCDGDKTVVSQSAIDSNLNPYYLNLFNYQKDTGNKFSHTNLVENPEIINLISNITVKTNKDTSHITTIKPSLSECRFKIFGIFSPADLDVYDSEGRHTGINRDISTDNFMVFDTEIPNSDFFMIGSQKYVVVPDEGEYNIKIDGTGNGVFTLDISTQENDQIINNISYNNIPVNPKLEAQVVVGSNNPEEIVLKIDSNGDGKIDQEIIPNNISPLSYLEIIRATIIDLKLSKKLEKSLLQQVDKIVSLIKKNKIDKMTDKTQKFLKKIEIGKKKIKEMNQIERDNLVEQINNLLNSF